MFKTILFLFLASLTSGASASTELAQFAQAGIQPGPLCIQLKRGCFTQRQLGYRSSEYFSIGAFKNLPKAGLYTSIYEARFGSSSDHARFAEVARSNGVDEILLVYALEAKEKLAMAYLATYTKTHPNKPARDEGDLHYAYHWEISVDGEVVETETVTGLGD